MGRYRPQAPHGAPLITAAGRARLQAEYTILWRQRRPEVVRALAAAAAEGDRSENAEYIYRRKELREIDRRVGFLQRRLAELRVIDTLPADSSRVFFGACVEIDDGRRSRRYRIVGPDEIDPELGDISVDSPLARALLKRTVGEQVRVNLPAGAVELEILDVRYPPHGG